MEEINNNVIKRHDPDFPESLDFQFLRKKGIERLSELAGKIWTDHNVHDPGITILEVLCYALIDLGYRTNLPIEELLARKTGASEDNFFTPAEILTVNPVTMLDYRKFIIDTPGVRNAWLEINEESQFSLIPFAFGDREIYQLSCFRKGSNDIDFCDFHLKGLYDVILELDRDSTGCPVTHENPEGVVDLVRDKLHAHRNLGEDFVNIHVACEEEISFCGQIVLSDDIDADLVYLEVLKALQEFLSPPLHFYSLDEMLERGNSIQQIFEGRPWQEESYGFLDNDEVEFSRRIKRIRLSDIYGLIGNIEGVKSVNDLLLKSNLNTNDPDDCNYWIHIIEDGHIPVFCSDATYFTFRQQGVQITPNRSRVIGKFRQFVAANVRVLQSSVQDKLPPKARFREDLGDYHSIQHEFRERMV